MTDVEVSYSILRNGVQIGAAIVVPASSLAGTLNFVIPAGVVFNGTTDTLDLRADYVATEGSDLQDVHGNATLLAAADAPVIDVNIYSPSNRLRLAVYGTFEPGPNTGGPAFVDDSDISVYFGTVIPTWQIRAMSKNPRTNRETPLQLAYPAVGTAVPLPDSYEMDSAAKLLRARLFLSGENFVSNANFPSTWKCVVYATWEPNIPINSDAELDNLYAACHIVPATTATINFGTS